MLKGVSMRSVINAALLAALISVSGLAHGLDITPGSARIKTIGGIQKGLWNLWSNGEFGDHVAFAKPGEYAIVLGAHGSPVGNEWPLAALFIDGRRRETFTVDSPDLKDYAFALKADARAYRITVAFLNDAMEGGEDRNLYIERLRVSPAAGLPEPTIATDKEITQMHEELGKQAAEAERLAVDAARKSIPAVRMGDAAVRVIDADGKPVPGAAVHAELVRHAFLFGCNIYMFGRFGKPEENAAYSRRFAELFNYATVAFYWASYEPEQGKPNYAYTDGVVSWCRERGIRMKGHPLLWGHDAGKPKWAGGKQSEPEIRRKRVFDIVRRFSGKIDFWEVVNEPSHCGELTIDEPYRWAREADPKARLIVNDYYVLADGCPQFLDLLTAAKRNGVPFDGIGIQAHEPRTDRFPLDGVRRILDDYAALGKGLHITEFTPCSSGEAFTGTPIRGTWDEAAQADYAAKFYTVCFAHPAVRAITWWDLCDAGSWLPGGGMLRKDLSPKPVYDALRKLIREEWHTKVDAKTDANGEIRLRGFYGRYAITAEAGNAWASAEASMMRSSENRFVVRIE